MPGIAHGGMNPRSTEKPKAPKKELEHLRVTEAENGGHMVEHHFTSFEHPPEQHVFGEPSEMGKPKLPEGHALAHIAKAMHMPYTPMGEKEESAHETNHTAHEPDEEEEIEAEA